MSDDKTTAGDNSPAVSRSDIPSYEVRLWPHRSLPRKGFRIVMTIVGIALALPVLPLMGTRVMWALLPFLVGAWGLLYLLIKRNYRDGRLEEHLRLWPDMICVERREPTGAMLRWQANPYWVDLTMHPNARPENYLTLRGAGRLIELGAFLVPEEREALFTQLNDALARVRATPEAAPWRPDV
jgi:uncharacterized membrane protein